MSGRTRLSPTAPACPAQAIEAPASVSNGSLLAPGVGSADAAQIVSTASTSGIPSAALAAYQRAETVINAADKSCHLTWQLIAAIGRVESNHGRVDGNVLDDNGLATPGIYGIALNGANSTTEIVDTDAGQFDNDTSYDRAVGPMQFIPSTWSVVGVDADGDGVRNPQDVDDAALGTAVYLCSGSDDLGTDQGRQAAVFRYNHSQSYVDLVLAIMDAYLEGDFTSIPNGTVMAGELTKAPPPLQRARRPDQHQRGRGQAAQQQQQHRRRRHAGHPADHRADHASGWQQRRRRQRRWRQRRQRRRWRCARPQHPRHDPAAAHDLDPAGRPGAHAGPGHRPVPARRRQPARTSPAFQQCLDSLHDPAHRGRAGSWPWTPRPAWRSSNIF